MSCSIIDAWANPVIPPAEGMPGVARLFAQSKTDTALLERRRTPSELVTLMDEAGIDQICICAWYKPGQAIFSNAEVAEFTRSYPDRFIGIAGCDLLNPVEAVQDVRKYVQQEGFKGVRVIPWLWGLPPNDKHYWPLYVECVALDVPFFTQVGHTGPLCPSETGRPVPYIDEIALKFPQLRIVCGHIGFPWTQEMIGVAWKHENMFIDTSAYLPKYYPPELIQFMNTTGKKKVMFGTNFPQLSWKTCVEQAKKQLDLREGVAEDFFAGNIRRVLKMERIKRRNMKL